MQSLAQRRSRALAAVTVLLSALLSALLGWLGAPTGASAAVTAAAPGSVLLAISDVSPNSPSIATSPHALRITLQLTNVTSSTLTHVTVTVDRGDPIASQVALNRAIAGPKPPSAGQVAPLPSKTVGTLKPLATRQFVYRTKTDIPQDTDLCLCANAIYPLYVTVNSTPPGSTPVQLAAAQTYLPSFTAQPARTRVGWLWPLLDRPHRLASNTLFLDDELGIEVSPGGRLDNLLQVAEQTAARVPMTLVTDPELIDELAVMSRTGGYRVKTPAGIVAGTHSADAAAWLARLRDVLGHDNMELALTPPSDPDIGSLLGTHLSWTTKLDPAAERRVTNELGGRTSVPDIYWPASGTIRPAALASVVGQRVRTVVLSDTGFSRPAARGKAIPDALAPLASRGRHVVAAVLSSSLERWISAVLKPSTSGGQGLTALPQLVAELAIRVELSLDQSHYVLLAPPRNLDLTDPATAVRTVLATADAPWSRPLPLRAAINSVSPVDHGRLGAAHGPRLPRDTITALQYVSGLLPDLPDLYATAAGAAFLANYPAAMQRCVSGSLLSSRALSSVLAETLSRRIHAVVNGVRLIPPSEGTYTLASKNAKLPITVQNNLPAPVNVRLVVTTPTGGPGFHAEDVDFTLPPNSKRQIPVVTHTDRIGTFDVQASLATQHRVLVIGRPIRLKVRSTALGTIGVVITVTAALVLVAALLVRFLRRLSRRRRPRPSPRPAAREPVPTPSS
jgi:hypothetical protein